MSDLDWLEPAARRSAGEAWTVGHAFERYRALEGSSQEELAKELGCSLEVLHWLSLCRCPQGEAFTEQVSTIAKRFAVDVLLLTQVLRRVEVMDRLSIRAEDGEARDRSHDGETNS
jgi:hypothetical protein